MIKNINTCIKIFAIIVFICVSISGCSIAEIIETAILKNENSTAESTSYSDKSEAAEESLISSEATEYSDEAAPVFFENYITQPRIDFGTYKPKPVVRGIYVSSHHAGGEYINNLIKLCNDSYINAMVIDVKTDEGYISFKNGIPLADEMGISVGNIPDIKELIRILNENNIYPIARIVTFKDDAAVKKRPELYIKDRNGSVWRDAKNIGWLNPYNKDSWEYILEIAKGAASIGFKEIQFDYIRFDTSSKLNDADFGETDGKSRIEIITEFTEYAVKTLSPLGVNISADVYGTIINSDLDASIVGQDYREMAEILDYICPMIYPSHYAEKSMGIDYPDLHPYDTIYKVLELSAKRLEGMENPAVLRPWLQDFTASWLGNYQVYGEKQRQEQIQAVYDAGYKEWLLWDASIKYDSAGIIKPPTN